MHEETKARLPMEYNLDEERGWRVARTEDLTMGKQPTTSEECNIQSASESEVLGFLAQWRTSPPWVLTPTDVLLLFSCAWEM